MYTCSLQNRAYQIVSGILYSIVTTWPIPDVYGYILHIHNCLQIVSFDAQGCPPVSFLKKKFGKSPFQMENLERNLPLNVVR